MAAICVVAACAALDPGSASASQLHLPYWIGLTSDVPPPMAPPSASLTALQRALNSDLNRQGGDNSALVVDVTTKRTLWAYNDTVSRLPASIEKLWTTATDRKSVV